MGHYRLTPRLANDFLSERMQQVGINGDKNIKKERKQQTNRVR